MLTKRKLVAILWTGFICLSVLSGCGPALTVNTTGDGSDVNPGDKSCDIGGGVCTLRAAIEEANAVAGVNKISFDIPAASDSGCIASTAVCTIKPTSALPATTDPVIIDGYTQPGSSLNINAATQGSNAVLKVELDGSMGVSCCPALEIGGENSIVTGLVIHSFGTGILLSSNGNRVEGNFIGTDVDGSASLGNVANGVKVTGVSNNKIGGTTPGSRNVISGNGKHGVLIEGSSATVVQGNLIGTDVSGSADLGNSLSGVHLLGASGNSIGGTVPGAGNVISANGKGVAITLSAEGNQLQGNFIGTDVSGTSALANGLGVEIMGSNNTVGGSAPGARNVISGNEQSGVAIMGTLPKASSGNQVQGNLIGTAANGVNPLGNVQHGVSLSVNATNNAIGGTTGTSQGGPCTGACNVIAHNGGAGIATTTNPAGADNPVRSNSIFSNNGLGIDLFPVGQVAGNLPVLTSATSGMTTIEGTLSGPALANFTVEFFANAACDPSNHGEGEIFIGSTFFSIPPSGTASFSVTVSAPVPAGQFITATVTDASGNTSEFSQCVQVEASS